MTERHAHLSLDHKHTAASSVDDILKEVQDRKASEDQQGEDGKTTEKKK
jgi:hypothetical protein